MLAKLSTTSDEFPIVDKPGTKSEIWRYFGLLSDKDEKPINNGTAVCHICLKHLLVSRTGNIVTLLRNSLKPEMVDMLKFLSSNVQPPS